MDVEQELLPLLKQLAEGVLKQRLAIQDLMGRVARLEHVQEHQLRQDASQIMAELAKRENAPVA